jgi:outer membrane protein OmpA-like peptidoglycan-associated protein
MYAVVQPPEEQMKRLLLLCSLLALAACAQPAPPPPVAAAPPPPPPPPPSQTFTVFFPWDSATLTPDAGQVVQAAAGAIKAAPPTGVQVTGYTDTSGSPAYNQGLSQRRAQSVADTLVQGGVPQTALTVSGQGENDLRVPTPPGVREPQNRRVEIVEGGASPPPPAPPPPAPGS